MQFMLWHPSSGTETTTSTSWSAVVRSVSWPRIKALHVECQHGDHHSSPIQALANQPPGSQAGCELIIIDTETIMIEMM